MSHILIVDDDHNTLASLSRAFRLAGYKATIADSAARALELLRAGNFDLIFSDVVMPGKDGITLLAEVRALGVTTPVVMMSGQGTLEMAVRATKLGALDFLEKPLSTERLLLTVENALRVTRLESENQELKARVGRHEIVWKSAPMTRVMSQVERVAASNSRVCILGETGTGKEAIARAIHEKSSRKAARFVTLNCAAVPAELIESELFGHEKGAFTGAASRHTGKFEQAHGGTLFLDEIGDMPAVMQAKLLRVLEEGEVERIGGGGSIAVDVRVVVATHRNLEDQVKKGAFRLDLFHRVYVFPLFLPPLRDRKGDIPALIHHFVQRISNENNWKVKSFTPQALALLDAYLWPGNVRELRNAVERLLLLAEGDIEESTVHLALPNPPQVKETPSGTLASRLDHLERTIITEELTRHQFNMTNTARALGLERSHLYKKCAQLGIDIDRLRQ